MNLRYKLPNQEKSILLSRSVKAESKTLAQANNDTRFAIAVAAYAQQLKGGQYNGAMGWDQIFNWQNNLHSLILIRCEKNLSSLQKLLKA